MIREVDLVDYLPPFIKEYKQIKATLEAENPEFKIIWEAADRVLYNEFIATADEYGISRFEKLLNIYPKTEDSLEIRRMRVQNRWMKCIPYTIKNLILGIREILGEYNFSIWSDFKYKYKLELSVYAMDDSQVEELEYLLSTMVPANIETNIVYETMQNGNIYYGAAMEQTDIIQIRQR